MASKKTKPLRLDEFIEKPDLLSNVFSSIQDGISILDNRLNIIRVNPAMEKWYVHAMPLVGKKCYWAYHGKNRPCKVCPSRRILRTRETAYEVIPKVGTRGKIVGWLDLYSFPLIDSKTGRLKGVIEYVRDISGRRKAETALQESEERYRTLVEYSWQGIFIAQGPPFRFLFANPAASQILGYTVDELTRFSSGEILNLVHPENLAEAKQRFMGIMKKGLDLKSGEFRLIRKDGDVRWVETYGRAIEYQGKPALQVTFLDITESKLAREALRDSEERFRSLVQSMDDIVYTLDCRQRHTGVHGNWLKKYRFKPSFFLGRTARDVFGKKAAAVHEAANKKVLEGKNHRYEWSSQMDGEIRYFETSVSPILDQNGRVSGIVGMGRDITGHKRIENELKQSREWFRAVFDASRDGIVVENNEMIFYANLAFAKLYGHKHPKELIGKHLSLLQSEQDNERMLEFGRRRLRGEPSPPVYEFRGRRKDGSFIELEASVSATEIGDKKYVIAMVRDITERKNSEKALADERNLLRTVIDNVPDRIYLKDQKARFILNNLAHLQALGVHQQSEALGKTDFDFRPKEMAERYFSDDQRVVRTGKPFFNKEEPTPTNTGEKGWLLVSKVPLRDREGKPIGLVGISRDITERKRAEETGKRAEEALRASEERYRSLVEAAKDAIVSVDSRGQIVLWNSAAQKMFGYLPEEIFNQPIMKIIPEASALGHQDGMNRMFSGGPSMDTGNIIEGFGIHKDGVKVPIEFTVRAWHAGEELFFTVIFRDIAERKRAEEALRESEERYRSFLQHFQGIAFRYAMDFTPVFFQGNVEKITGYLEKELLAGEPRWVQIIQPDDIHHIIEQSKRIQTADHFSIEREYRIIRKDKHIRWIHELIQSIPDGSGKPVMIQGALYDITERKDAENALQKSMDRLKLLTDNMVDSISQVDANRIVVYVSPSVKRMLGYEISEIIGKPVLDLVHPDDREKLVATIIKARQSLLPSNRIIYRYRHKEGHYIWVESETRLFYDEAGNFNGAIFGSRDITERKKVEEALRESEANFSALAENANDAILIATDGNSHEYANHRAAKLTGYSVMELSKIGSNHLFTLGQNGEMGEEAAAIKTGQRTRQQYETLLICKDKTIIPVEVSVSVTTWKGRTADLVFFRDIAERKKMEDRIQQDIREKDVMLKEIHHRVKNNLQIISSLLHLQSKYIQDEIALNMFKESQNRIRSMAMIHEELYNSGNLAKVDFGDYVENLVTQLFRSYGMGMERVQLKIDIHQTFLDVNTAIPCGLIINELVSNSLKYAFPEIFEQPDESKPKQNLIRIELMVSDPGHYELVVGDNGVGLPKDFDFQSIDTLGLRIIKALVEQLEGTIQLDPKGGTQFKILFKA